MKVLRTGLALLIGGVLICAAIVLPLLGNGVGGSNGTGAQMGAANGQPGSTPDNGDLSSVRTFADQSTQHTPDDVDYAQSPPVGGEHADQWLECGAYDKPVREENAVHALEHGTVWITYAPDLDAADIATLEAALPDEGILSPHEGQTAPVVVTVWATQLALEGVEDSRLALFIEEYGNGETAPEPMASCHGGVVRYDGEGGETV